MVVFWLAIRAIVIAGFFLSLILICVSLYSLLSKGSEHQIASAVIGIPSIFLLTFTIKLFWLRDFSCEEVNKWYTGKKE